MTTPPGYEYTRPPDVANDYEDGIENPDWAPFTVDGAMTFDQDRHGNAGLLTIHGVLDTLHHIEEEGGEFIKAFLEGDIPENQLPEWLRRTLPTNLPPPVDVRASVDPARHFRTTTFVLPPGGAPTLISAMGSRKRAVITNTGTSPALLSWTDDFNNVNTAGMMEAITLPALSPSSGQTATLSNTASQVTPAGGTAIASLAVGPGTYQVAWSVEILTAAATVPDNMRLAVNNGATTYSTSMNGTAVGQYPNQLGATIIGASALQTIGVYSIAAEATGTYKATIQVTQIPSAVMSGVANPRVLTARGKIYAWAAASTTVDILEEYGELERRGIYNGPAGG